MLKTKKLLGKEHKQEPENGNYQMKVKTFEIVSDKIEQGEQ